MHRFPDRVVAAERKGDVADAPLILAIGRFCFIQWVARMKSTA
jgi:hypothetical protein